MVLLYLSDDPAVRLRAQLQAPRNGAQPSVRQDEPQVDEDLSALQQDEWEARPGPGQQEGGRERGGRRPSR